MSSIKVLLWKEYREIRLAFLAFAVLSVIFMAANQDSTAIPYFKTIEPAYLMMVLFLPLFAGFTGANLIAPEIGEGTLPFLLTRPLSHLKVWSVKILAGVTAILSYAAFNYLLASLMGNPLTTWMLRFRESEAISYLPLTIIELSFFVFALGVFCSTITDRAIYSFSISALLGGCCLWGLSFLNLWQGLDTALLSASVSLLAASAYFFNNGEIILSRVPLRLQSAGICAVTAFVFVCLYGQGAWLYATAAVNENHCFISTPSGSHLLYLSSERRRPREEPKRIWNSLIRTDVSLSQKRIPLSYGEPIAISDDGEFSLWVNLENVFGLTGTSRKLSVFANNEIARLPLMEGEHILSGRWNAKAQGFILHSLHRRRSFLSFISKKDWRRRNIFTAEGRSISRYKVSRDGKKILLSLAGKKRKMQFFEKAMNGELKEFRFSIDTPYCYLLGQGPGDSLAVASYNKENKEELLYLLYTDKEARRITSLSVNTRLRLSPDASRLLIEELSDEFNCLKLVEFPENKILFEKKVPGRSDIEWSRDSSFAFITQYEKLRPWDEYDRLYTISRDGQETSLPQSIQNLETRKLRLHGLEKLAGVTKDDKLLLARLKEGSIIYPFQ